MTTLPIICDEALVPRLSSLFHRCTLRLAIRVTRVAALEPLVGKNTKIFKINKAIFVQIGSQPTGTYVYPEHIVTDITCSRICSEDARLHRLKIGLKTGKMKIPGYNPVNSTNLH
jgi:hypothetical protein